MAPVRTVMRTYSQVSIWLFATYARILTAVDGHFPEQACIRTYIHTYYQDILQSMQALDDHCK